MHSSRVENARAGGDDGTDPETQTEATATDQVRPLAPQIAAATAPAGAPRAHGARGLCLLGLAGLAAGAVVVSGAVVGGKAFISHQPGAWFFGTPGGPLGSISGARGRAALVAMVAVYGGLVVLCRVWLEALRRVRNRPGTPVRAVLGMAGLWAVPFALGPPLFSLDVYSYAGQGEMVSHHINPYVYGPAVLGATPFSRLPAPFWGNTPSPYGPTFLWLDGLLIRLGQHQALACLVLLRGLEVAGVLLAVWGLASLARSGGYDPARAVLLGAASPLVLITLVSGAHNDALMTGLLVAGLAVARRVGPVPGMVVCALAAGVKAPAALGVVFIAWTWPGRNAAIRDRLWRCGLAAAIGAGTLQVVSAVSGLGWGWLRDLSAADRVQTGVTPVDALAHLLQSTAALLGVPVNGGAVRSGVVAIGFAAAAAIGVVQLRRASAAGPVGPLGASLLAVALLGPILWPWYLTWGLAVLAVGATGARLRVLVALIAVETVLEATPVHAALLSLLHSGLPALLGAAAALALAAFARSSWFSPPPAGASIRRRRIVSAQT